jgi:hypothetical protein
MFTSLSVSILTIVEKTFTRKLHVPTKHIVQLSDPCETPPPLTIKHLYMALLKIIQTGLAEKEEQERMKETIRTIEKCASGHENILATTREWLKYMDPKHPPREGDEIFVASKLIDWALCTTVCRDELETNVETLKTLQKENLAAQKTLRTGTSPHIFMTDVENGRKRRESYIKIDSVSWKKTSSTNGNNPSQNSIRNTKQK